MPSRGRMRKAMCRRYYLAMIGNASSRTLRLRNAFVVAFLSAAGCAQLHLQPSAPPPAPLAPVARYEPVTTQDEATIAELRAAPPPSVAEISTGGTKPSADETLLNARGLVRIGDGYVPAKAGDPRSWAQEQGRHVGADKILIYAPDDDGTTQLAFYVRYRLPFGATFRSLTAEEQKALGSGGVQLGEVVGGTPASEANLRHGDFVVRFNGQPFADRAAFQRLLRENMGKRVTLTIRRGSASIQRLVRIGSPLRTEAKKQ